MFLFEFEGKELLRQYGISRPEGILFIPGDIDYSCIEKLHVPLVVKAQVLTGGRGKRGLVQVAKGVKQAREIIDVMFGEPLDICRVLVEEKIDYERELYLSIGLSAKEGKFLLMGSSRGGVEIEASIAVDQKLLTSQLFDPFAGLFSFQAMNMAYALSENVDQAKRIAAVISNLYKLFVNTDSELVEINPLFICKTGSVVAGDCKIVIDDNALFRHQQFSLSRDRFESDLEYEAARDGIPYLQFDGDISLMCAGAGLTNTVYDLVNLEGGTVASYLEFGGPNYRKAIRAMEISLKTPSKVILIVTFGTIARADVMAKGIAEAVDILKPDRPVITCIRGTNEGEANEILTKINVEVFDDTEKAVSRAVQISKTWDAVV